MRKEMRTHSYSSICKYSGVAIKRFIGSLCWCFSRLSPRGVVVDFSETMCAFWMTINDQVTEWGRLNCFDLRRICDWWVSDCVWSPPSNLSSSNGLLGRLLGCQCCHPSSCLLVVNVFRQQETVREVTAPAMRWFSRYGLEEVRLKSYLPWHLRPVSIFPYKFIKVIGFKRYWITFTILSLCYPISVLHYSFSSQCTALGSHFAPQAANQHAIQTSSEY